MLISVKAHTDFALLAVIAISNMLKGLLTFAAKEWFNCKLPWVQ